MGLTRETRERALRSLFEGQTLYVSLHVADPGETGNQLTNEVEYVDYERVEAGAWVFRGDKVLNEDMIQFPKAASDALVTHIGIGLEPRGGGKLLVSSPCVTPIPLKPGIVPVIGSGEYVYSLKSRAAALE